QRAQFIAPLHYYLQAIPFHVPYLLSKTSYNKHTHQSTKRTEIRMADLVGQQLGNYRLIRLLGKGGYAEVYLGEHIRLNTQAAIKVLHTRLANSEEVEIFQNEGRTIARLLHPHIIRVFDFDVENDIPFMVMDYAPNGTLRKRHPRGTRLPLPSIISYVQQVGGALQYAHDQQLVHRD